MAAYDATGKRKEYLATLPLSGWEQWKAQALHDQKHGGQADAIAYAWARAYTELDPDSFRAFCVDVLGFGDFYPPLHGTDFNCLMLDDPRHDLLLCFRESMKSHIATMGLSLFFVAREAALFERCDLRILFASENRDLSGDLVNNTANLVRRPRFVELFGNHLPKKPQGSSRQWKSALRRLERPENTFESHGIGGSKSGRHYQLIFGDDIEAETFSGSLRQIMKCYRLYRLFHNLLNTEIEEHLKTVLPGGISRIYLRGTHWHPQDVYEQIERDDGPQFRIQKLSCWKNKAKRESRWPSRFTPERLAAKRLSQGARIFGAQMEMNTNVEDSEAWPHSRVHVYDELPPDQPYNTYLCIDVAYSTEAEVFAGEVEHEPDYCVSLALRMDHRRHYWFGPESWREQCGTTKLIERVHRMNEDLRAKLVAASRFDRSTLVHSFKDYSRLWKGRRKPVIKWVPAVGRPHKIAAIERGVGPPLAQGRIHVHSSLRWFLNEFQSFGPVPDTVDGLDAARVGIEIATPPLAPGSQAPHEREGDSHMHRRLERLKRGQDPQTGEPADGRGPLFPVARRRESP